MSHSYVGHTHSPNIIFLLVHAVYLIIFTEVITAVIVNVQIQLKVATTANMTRCIIFSMTVASMKRTRLLTVVPLPDLVLKLDPPHHRRIGNVSLVLICSCHKVRVKHWGTMPFSFDMICTAQPRTMPSRTCHRAIMG